MCGAFSEARHYELRGVDVTCSKLVCKSGVFCEYAMYDEEEAFGCASSGNVVGADMKATDIFEDAHGPPLLRRVELVMVCVHSSYLRAYRQRTRGEKVIDLFIK